LKAAVLHEFGKPPHYEEFPDPHPTEGEVLVQMKAAALSRINKSRASGSHYDSHRALPVVVGIDGMGLLEDGTRVYCGGTRPPYGTMSELTVVPKVRTMPVPAGVSDFAAAALPNAALSSWLPLAYKAQLQRGETVLIMGATGASGKVAIQVAKYLGAGPVVAAGRNEAVLKTLGDLGADSTISLSLPEKELMDAFEHEASKHPFNIVLDYVWGHPAEVLMSALTRHDLMAEETRTRFVSIGSLAGLTASIPSAALRSSGLEIYGSGGGSASFQAIAETFPKFWSAAAQGKIKIDTEPVPLADVEQVWNRAETKGRIVFVIP
jgi:NADPH:quinone reductase-like Zn-dependent oxidoreductase